MMGQIALNPLQSTKNTPYYIIKTIITCSNCRSLNALWEFDSMKLNVVM